jgi:hypothetical protein
LSLTNTAPTFLLRQVDLVATSCAMDIKYSGQVGLGNESPKLVALNADSREIFFFSPVDV